MWQFAVYHLELDVGANRQLKLKHQKWEFPKILGLKGPSGIGKSSFLKALVGLRQSIDRRFYWELQSRRFSPEWRIGYVDQQEILLDSLSAADHFYQLTTIPSHEIPQWLKNWGLWEARQTPAAWLSGGQRKRLAMALSLAINPQVLIWDEAFNGIDAPLRAQIHHHIRQFLSQRPTPLILTAHDPDHSPDPQNTLWIDLSLFTLEG